jgi:hypothetical protein
VVGTILAVSSSNLYLFHRLKLKGNHNPFQLSRNLERAEVLSQKIRIATQVSFEDEIKEEFQKEIVQSDYVNVLFIIGNYLCQEIYEKYYTVVIEKRGIYMLANYYESEEV